MRPGITTTMPRPQLVLAVAGTCAALAAGAQPSVPPLATTAPAAEPAPPPPPPVTRYDGRYSGTATRTSRASAQCTARTLRATMTVRGGQASLTAGSGRTAPPLEGTVAEDSTLALSSVHVNGDGRFARNRFTGQARSGGCTWRISLAKAAR